MRRPAPLPAEPARPDEAVPESDAAAPPPIASLSFAADQEPLPLLGAESSAEAVDEPSTGDDEASAPEVDEAPAALRSRDVWKAARARRKALRAEIRRFTKGSRRRRAIWLSSIGAVLALVAGCVAAAYSPLFAVERITVVGASGLDAAMVEASLTSQLGTPLALVDDSAVKAALTAFPLIETYSLEARPPHDLTVRIVERTPVGVVSSAAGFTLVDAAGVVLSTTPGRPDGQPLLEITGGVESKAFASAGEVIRSVPAGIRDQLTAVSATSPDDVTLRLSSGASVVWGSADRSPYKATVLEATMAARPDASRYDVSSPDAVVVG